MPCVTKRYNPLKRLIDIAGAICGLVLLSPLFIGIAVWVKLDSVGPVFYRQTRVTRGGRHFKALKFRSMRMAIGDAGSDGITTPDKYDRITRSGHFIRKYRIDELAQLWNVLTGDMSLVGPRPQTPKYIDIFPETYAVINSVRPGITGLASIKYHETEERELKAAGDNADAVYIAKLMPIKFKYDLFYIRHYGLWFDIKIIWWTIVGMIKKANK
jgi:lipopolysaccharide/colanic/teichoic acid biosynthesis glycosyltransferase